MFACDEAVAPERADWEPCGQGEVGGAARGGLRESERLFGVLLGRPSGWRTSVGRVVLARRCERGGGGRWC